jgi:putative DNA primase/helicase
MSAAKARTYQIDAMVTGAVRQLRGGAPPDLLLQPFNDYGNGQRLIAVQRHNLRYCHDFRKWLAWDGRRWAVDESDLARKMVQDAMLEFARQAMASGNETTSKFAGRCLNSQRLTSALYEAQPHLAIQPSELDSHPYVLNFANGTVDLRTGQLTAPNRKHFITKLVHFDYAWAPLAPYSCASCAGFWVMS